MPEKQKLFAQINAIENEIMRDELCEYVRQQLKDPSKINEEKPLEPNQKLSRTDNEQSN